MEPVASKVLSVLAREPDWPIDLQTIEPTRPYGPPVDIWSWRIDVDAEWARRESECLTGDERLRMERLRTPELRSRFQATRGRLRRILAAYTSVPAAELRLRYGANGKPSIDVGERPAPYFNLTHSEQIAAVAVSQTGPVGIDVELVRPIEDSVAEEIFVPAEIGVLEELPGDRRLRAFYRGWTRKEAVVKAIGEGLSLPLKSFSVSLAADDSARILRADTFAPSDWRLVDFSPDPNHIGAVAISSADWSAAVPPRL